MMDEEMMRALEADGDKLRQLTGEDHGPYFLSKESTQTSDNDSGWAGFHTNSPPPVVAPQQPRAVQPAPRPADAFRNMFAILHNLETSDLPFMTAEQRLAFFRDPIPAILRLDDARLDALWRLVNNSQPERYRVKVEGIV